MNRLNLSNTDGGDRLFSTAEAAAAIGVSVTTVKRWVDDGILPAQRTPGGHRKLWGGDIRRLIRDGTMPEMDLSALDADGSRGDEAVRLADALRAGDGARVRRILHDAYRKAGRSIASIADEIVSPAMAAIGHGWSTGQIDVFHEHRGTQLCAAALYELKAAIESQSPKNRLVAIGGAPEFDHYFLPSLCAQMTLLDSGWNAVNIGPNTPASSLRRALDEFEPRLLWLSASYLKDENWFVEEYGELFRTAANRNIAVSIGGRAFVDDVRRRLSYASYGDGLSHLEAFARSLSPPPRRPRRGRPRRA